MPLPAGIDSRGASLVWAIAAVLAWCGSAGGAYKAVTPRRKLAPGEVAVSRPGNFDKASTTYVLTADISSATSPIFLGKDVTLDLNGHTVTYAAGGYHHVTNHSFEKGLTGWDVSKAPDAVAKDMTMIHPLVGRNVCVLPQGQELVSSYVTLPVAGRSYYAMVAVADRRSRVSVFVDDAKGRPVRCEFRFGSNVRQTCPELNRSPKLGGGVVFALLHGLPAGKYRIRVRAVQGQAVIDEVDIRPAMDVGVSIIEKTRPWAYYKCILDGDACAFFDYTAKGTAGTPVDSVARVSGAGTVTIRNGTIRSGCVGIRSWGVQSTARGVKVVLDNVRFQAAGINTNAASVAFGVMKDCRVEIDTPWIIDRHRRDSAVVFWGDKASEIADNEFLGGQGCLTIRGDGTRVADNLFVNDQRVTNHYCLSLDAHRAEVCNNRFLPKRGAGIYIYRHRDNTVHDNTFRIVASPPINEYSRSDYSVSAVRISDYNAAKGSARGWCEGNRIHRNTIHVVGRDIPGASPKYEPMAYGFFISVGGGVNTITDNDITVEHRNPESKTAGAYAFYIGGSNQGGVIHGNRITTNVTPFWISNRYGAASNVLIYGNTITRARGAGKVVPFRLGYWKLPSKNVGLYSNRLVGMDFGVTISDHTTGYVSQYAFGWTLTVRAVTGAEVVVTDEAGKTVRRGRADSRGLYVARLPQFTAVGRKQTDCSRYVVASGRRKQTITMTADRTVTLR